MEAMLGAYRRLGFSKRSVLRATVGACDTTGDEGVRRGRRVLLAVGTGREPEHPREARRERAEALEADGEADVGDRAVRGSKQRCGPLEPSREEVGMRRDTEGALERLAEM